MKEYLRLQEEVHNCKEDSDCSNVHEPDGFDDHDLTMACVNIDIEKFKAHYCLPVQFCNKSLTVDGKSVTWICPKSGIVLGYNLVLGAVLAVFISM